MKIPKIIFNVLIGLICISTILDAGTTWWALTYHSDRLIEGHQTTKVALDIFGVETGLILSSLFLLGCMLLFFGVGNYVLDIMAKSGHYKWFAITGLFLISIVVLTTKTLVVWNNFQLIIK